MLKARPTVRPSTVVFIDFLRVGKSISPWLLILLLVFMSASGTGVGRAGAPSLSGGFVYGGFHTASGYGGGTLHHVRGNLDANQNAGMREAFGAGGLVVVQFELAGPSETFLRRFREWAEWTDFALIAAIVLAGDGREDANEVLLAVRSLIGEKTAVMTFVMPAADTIEKSAEGFWWLWGGGNYSASEAVLRVLVETGKPVGIALDVSKPPEIERMRELVMLAMRFDLPISYRVGSGLLDDLDQWFAAGRLNRVGHRNFVLSALAFQRRAEDPGGMGAGDLFWGNAIELSGDFSDQVEFSWTGIDSATVFGFSRIDIGSGMVELKTESEVVLEYHFWSALSLGDISLTLPINGNPHSLRVEILPAGMSGGWRELTASDVSEGSSKYFLGEMGREFRLRISILSTDVAFGGGRLTGSVERDPGRMVELSPAYHEKTTESLRYRQSFDAGQWRSVGGVSGAEHLEPGPELAMRGRNDSAASATVVQGFSSRDPLDEIVIRIFGEIRSGHGGAFSLGVSLDGETIVYQGDRWTETGTYEADLRAIASFVEVDRFFVHLQLFNFSGIRGEVATTLKSLEIDASIANPSFDSGRMVGVERPPIRLSPEYYLPLRGGIRYHQNLRLGAWPFWSEVTNGGALEPGPMPAMRGRDGYAVVASISQRFVSDVPLELVALRLTGGIRPQHGGSFWVEFSLDGKEVVYKGTAVTASGTYTADLSRVPVLQGVEEFYVHLYQRNGSGVRSNVSSWLKDLEIDARYVGASFARWRFLHFSENQRSDVAVSGTLATPAGDGITNLMKYAFQLGPWDFFSATDIIGVEPSDGKLQFTYFERSDVPDIRYRLLISDNLTDWHDSEPYLNFIERVAMDRSWNRVKAESDLTLEKSVFWRIVVERFP